MMGLIGLTYTFPGGKSPCSMACKLFSDHTVDKYEALRQVSVSATILVTMNCLGCCSHSQCNFWPTESMSSNRTSNIFC